MKQLLLLFIFSFSISYGQDFTSVDKTVETYPKYSKPEQLANRIARDFKNDLNRTRAIFKWLTNNIRYNLDEYYNPKPSIRFRYSSEEERLQKIQGIIDDLVKEAFIRKIGVCEDYAQSFKKVADLLGIESRVMKGYVRNAAYDIGNVPPTTNHAWNVVKISGNWIILDATWASGYVYNGRWVRNFNEYYFAIDPKKINRTHYPDDRKWQIVLNYKSLEDFYNQPIYSQNFLRTGMEVISPTKGNIVLNRNQDIELTIKNLSERDRLYYNYKGQRYSKKPVIDFKNNIAKITIENPGRDTELYLFLNRNIALEYKVDVQ